MKRLPVSCLAAVLVWFAISSQAEEITLRALSAFPEGTFFSRNFERLIEKITGCSGQPVRCLQNRVDTLQEGSW